MRRYLLQFQEADGSVKSEVLYSKDDDAGLVDPDGAPLSTTETFVMHGRAWSIVDIHVQKNLVHITCVEATASVDREAGSYEVARQVAQ